MSLADQFGLTLCESCGMPQEMHAGYDHGKGKCLLHTSGLSLRLDGRKTGSQRLDLISRLNGYFKAMEEAGESDQQNG